MTLPRSIKWHFYRYYHNWAVGIGFEKTFVGLKAMRFGLGWWCFSVTWRMAKVNSR